MSTFETIDDAVWFLHTAGWSTAEARLLSVVGLRWMVTATKDEQDIRGEAGTLTEAYRAVAEMAAEFVEW